MGETQENWVTPPQILKLYQSDKHVLFKLLTLGFIAI